MPVQRIRMKPLEMEIIRWENNEAEIRDFVKNDRSLRFPDGPDCQIWDDDTNTWITVPAFHYIGKERSGQLHHLSPENLDVFEKIQDQGNEPQDTK